MFLPCCLMLSASVPSPVILGCNQLPQQLLNWHLFNASVASRELFLGSQRFRGISAYFPLAGSVIWNELGGRDGFCQVEPAWSIMQWQLGCLRLFYLGLSQ